MRGVRVVRAARGLREPRVQQRELHRAELAGYHPQLSDAVNASLNQTLARTILTSLTTFIVVAILYFFGGEGIHGFAFCLVVGILVGTYSSKCT